MMINIPEGLRGKKFLVLDDGHVVLIDVMGDDSAICDAARTTTGSVGRSRDEDRSLIRYLMRRGEMSPFEQAELKLHVRLPMDVARQWVRYRTAHLQEYSTRYREAIDSAQRTNPAQWRTQSDQNKQGSGDGEVDWPDIETMMECHENWPTAGSYLSHAEQELQIMARQVYEERLKFGVAREQARKDLPLSTYTEWVWKIDLRNLFHFLQERMDGHAQLEIRSYANIIGREIVALLFPLAWQAFADYRLESMTLSRLDIEAIRRIVPGPWVALPDVPAILAEIFPNKREREEFVAKAERLGFC